LAKIGKERIEEIQNPELARKNIESKINEKILTKSNFMPKNFRL